MKNQSHKNNLVGNIQPGDRIELHYKVGGGGGHSLTIQNAVFKLICDSEKKVKEDKISLENEITAKLNANDELLQDQDTIAIQSLSV